METPVLYCSPLACADDNLTPISRVVPLLCCEMLHGTGTVAARFLMLYERQDEIRGYKRLESALEIKELRALSGLTAVNSGLLLHGELTGAGEIDSNLTVNLQLVDLTDDSERLRRTVTVPAAEAERLPGAIAGLIGKELLSLSEEIVRELKKPLASSLEAFASFVTGVDQISDPAATEIERADGLADVYNAIELDPQFFRAREYLFARGVYLSRCHQTEDAVEIFNRLLTGAITDPRLFRALAEAWIRAEEYGKALAPMERAFVLDPLDDDVLLRLAWLSESLQQYETAQNYYEQALERGMEELDVRERLGNLALQLGKFADAVVHFGVLTTGRPEDGAAWFGLAQAEIASGGEGRSRGLEAVRQGIRAEEGFWGNWWLLGQMAPDAEEREQGLARARELNPVIDRSEEDRKAFQDAMQRVQSGEMAEGIEDLQGLLKRDPRFWEAHMFLALALRECGRGEEAVEHVREALKYRPDSPDLHNELTVWALEQKDYKQALIHAGEACRLDPEHIGYRCNLGMSYLYKGDFDDAERQFLQARFQDPTSELPENCLELLQELKRQSVAAESRGVIDKLKGLLG